MGITTRGFFAQRTVSHHEGAPSDGLLLAQGAVATLSDCPTVTQHNT